MKIGIIGGFGPETTAKFYLSIIEKNRKKSDSHLDMLIQSAPVSFDLERNIIIDENTDGFLPLLLHSVNALQNADIIALPCNTLHIFIEDMRAASRKPILSIIEETVKDVTKRKIKKAGILSTSKTSSARLIESKLAENSIETVRLPDGDQCKLSTIIYESLCGKRTDEMKQSLAEMCEKLSAQGAEIVILACTDLQLILRQDDVDITLIDTLDVLAESIIKLNAA